jgi:hypothetical protein
MAEEKFIKKEPFMKLEEDGKASILNYNIPGSTTYEATSSFSLDLDSKLFKVTAKREPTKDYWDIATKIPVEVLADKIKNGYPLEERMPIILGDKIARTNQHGIINDPRLEDMITKDNYKEGVDTKVNIKTYSYNSGDAESIKNKNATFLANKVKAGYLPIYRKRFSGLYEWIFRSKPSKAVPKISIVLHLKMSTYLGDYGAGRTIKTFSLLPGEKTKISVRSYDYQESIKKASQNVLDSFSESSAEELQTTIEREKEMSMSLESSRSVSESSHWEAGGGGGLDLGIISFGASGGGGGSSHNRASFSQALDMQTKLLVNSTSKHTARSDSFREVEVNTSTDTTSVSENEKTIVRELENINSGRVLNFVFRQMFQEFISLTYVYDVSFVYTTGFPSQRRSCKLSGLREMLDEILINDKVVDDVENQLYSSLSSIEDYNGELQELVEKAQHKVKNFRTNKIVTSDYVRLNKGMIQEYKGKSINGIILDTTHRIMRTPSVIVDALLGQGEALDPYNKGFQEVELENLELKNEKLKQGMDIINNITDPLEKAKMYSEIFGNDFEMYHMEATEEDNG